MFDDHDYNSLLTIDQQFIEDLSNEKGVWYETRQEVAAGLAWGAEKAKKLDWVRAQMETAFSEKQRYYLEAYFFQGLSFREIAKNGDVKVAVVFRSIHRSIRRLQKLAYKQDLLAVLPPELRHKTGNQPYRRTQKV